MIIITEKRGNILREIGEYEGRQTVGNWLVRDSSGQLSAFSPELFDKFETENVPEEVVPVRWCYTEEKGFYRNTDYTEPNRWHLEQRIVEEIKAEAITEIQTEVTNGEM